MQMTGKQILDDKTGKPTKEQVVLFFLGVRDSAGEIYEGVTGPEPKEYLISTFGHKSFAAELEFFNDLYTVKKQPGAEGWRVHLSGNPRSVACDITWDEIISIVKSNAAFFLPVEPKANMGGARKIFTFPKSYIHFKTRKRRVTDIFSSFGERKI